ncbi:MAG: MarR family transcriptional regulator [Cyanobacteria bacterium TGS_CYA1]|nr:MarR family transcriptional regulator [Cyanobacteria bacterium TGS_CYA1]MDX2104831.1 MarR family transcriptional regulator [Candidatus Melainabacteria bacterium]
MKKAKQNPNTSGIHAWLLLWKTARAVETYAHRRIQLLELGVSDFGVLEALLHKGDLPINALGSKVLLTSSSMTAAVDRLESQGLVERKNDPNDRRARLVSLTPKGQKLIERAFKTHAKDMEQIMSPLSEQERNTLITLLHKLGHHAETII